MNVVPSMSSHLGLPFVDDDLTPSSPMVENLFGDSLLDAEDDSFITEGSDDLFGDSLLDAENVGKGQEFRTNSFLSGLVLPTPAANSTPHSFHGAADPELLEDLNRALMADSVEESECNTVTLRELELPNPTPRSPTTHHDHSHPTLSPPIAHLPEIGLSSIGATDVEAAHENAYNVFAHDDLEQTRSNASGIPTEERAAEQPTNFATFNPCMSVASPPIAQNAGGYIAISQTSHVAYSLSTVQHTSSQETAVRANPYSATEVCAPHEASSSLAPSQSTFILDNMEEISRMPVCPTDRPKQSKRKSRKSRQPQKEDKNVVPTSQDNHDPTCFVITCSNLACEPFRGIAFCETHRERYKASLEQKVQQECNTAGASTASLSVSTIPPPKQGTAPQNASTLGKRKQTDLDEGPGQENATVALIPVDQCKALCERFGPDLFQQTGVGFVMTERGENFFCAMSDKPKWPLPQDMNEYIASWRSSEGLTRLNPPPWVASVVRAFQAYKNTRAKKTPEYMSLNPFPLPSQPNLSAQSSMIDYGRQPIQRNILPHNVPQSSAPLPTQPNMSQSNGMCWGCPPTQGNIPQLNVSENPPTGPCYAQPNVSAQSNGMGWGWPPIQNNILQPYNVPRDPPSRPYHTQPNVSTQPNGMGWGWSPTGVAPVAYSKADGRISDYEPENQQMRPMQPAALLSDLSNVNSGVQGPAPFSSGWQSSFVPLANPRPGQGFGAPSSSGWDPQDSDSSSSQA